MILFCAFCEEKHDDFNWKTRIESGKLVNLCRKTFDHSPDVSTGVPPDLSRKGKRVNHWQEIASRVRTHEGELLSGNKGRDYQQRYAQKHLGISPRKNDFNSAAFQKELAKTK